MNLPPPLRFTEADVERAAETWGANCGPGALAAVMGMTLDNVRPHLIGFDGKRYTNPTMMLGALRSLRLSYRMLLRPPATSRTLWPVRGLVRIQWTGSWMKPGVPMAARYRHTHWIAVATRRANDIGVFDVNAMASGGWVPLANWRDEFVPYLTANIPRADGGWHATHVLELARSDA